MKKLPSPLLFFTIKDKQCINSTAALSFNPRENKLRIITSFSKGLSFYTTKKKTASQVLSYPIKLDNQIQLLKLQFQHDLLFKESSDLPQAKLITSTPTSL